MLFYLNIVYISCGVYLLSNHANCSVKDLLFRNVQLTRNIENSSSEDGDKNPFFLLYPKAVKREEILLTSPSDSSSASIVINSKLWIMPTSNLELRNDAYSDSSVGSLRKYTIYSLLKMANMKAFVPIINKNIRRRKRSFGESTEYLNNRQTVSLDPTVKKTAFLETVVNLPTHVSQSQSSIVNSFTPLSDIMHGFPRYKRSVGYPLVDTQYNGVAPRIPTVHQDPVSQMFSNLPTHVSQSQSAMVNSFMPMSGIMHRFPRYKRSVAYPLVDTQYNGVASIIPAIHQDPVSQMLSALPAYVMKPKPPVYVPIQANPFFHLNS